MQLNTDNVANLATKLADADALESVLRQLSFESRSRAMGLGAKSFALCCGISEKQARRELRFHKMISELPELEVLVRTGALSFEMASLIAGCADEDSALLAELLAFVSSEPSYEALEFRISEIRNRGKDAADRHKLRRRDQYVSISTDDDNMVVGHFKLLPELAASWLGDWQKRERQALLDNDLSQFPLPPAAASAEAFSKMLAERGGAKKSRSTISFHIDFDAWQRGWVDDGEHCEIAGLGPVPVSVVRDAYKDSALRLIMTSNNKLVWFSQGHPTDKPLPEFVKTMVKASNYDKCSVVRCINKAVDVDHILAKINAGTHDLDNLQPLCRFHHDLKTRRDAPWTIGGIYGKTRQQRREERERRKRRPKPSDDPLEDTG